MDISFLFKIAGIGLIVVIMQQILSRAGREEIATLIVLTGIIFIIIMITPHVVAVIEELSSVLNI